MIAVPHLESRLAVLLQYGTAGATVLIALGLALSHPPTVVAGIGLLIALPVARLVVMLLAFLRARDHRFAAITATVLVVIMASLATG